MKAPDLYTVFTDTSNKSYSWSRVICTVLIIAAVIWGSLIVYWEHKIADFTTVAVLVGAIYGLNRAGEAYSQAKTFQDPDKSK